MKTLRNYTLTFLSASLFAFVVTSCNKEIDYKEELYIQVPDDLDEDAATWASVNNDPTDVTLAKIQTAAETSTPKIFDPGNDEASVQNLNADTYKAELQAIKDLQKNLTGEQKKIIKYWSAGGVLRWNQILRGLVAKYNLPPAPKGDGTYPAPDAENPFGDPNFPFANPPYASRSYSYVSVAQYEALKAAWYYMYHYNRPSPYITDSGIQSLMPETNLPAYPSHDAVLSGVTAEMLKLLFPAAIEEITMKAAEQRNAALWSGRATSSDIAKGLALGKSVANLFINRARNDRMGNSGGNKALWKALEDDAIAKGETPWISLETPKRPPMLPFFGLRDGNSVDDNKGAKTWIMTKDDIVNNRPVPPPSTSSGEMAKEVAEVKWYSKNLTRERLAIVHKWADGVNTHTPAGHWNDIATEYIRDANWSEVRTARAFALLNITMHEAAVVCWDTKFFYFNPRPTQLDPSIKTATGIPNFPSFTSGHSTFSGSAAGILSYLFPDGAAYFEREALEASYSRLYGGIHYRYDVEKGFDHGHLVADFVVNFAQNDGADD